MMRRPRRNHSPTFTATVALAAIRGDQPLAELAQQFDVHPNQSKPWTDQRLAGMTAGFDGGGTKAALPESAGTALHATIGQLPLENDC